eukprot:12267220-Karenia_brevis.AAC.1
MLQTLSVVRINGVQEPQCPCRKTAPSLEGVDVANPFTCLNHKRLRDPIHVRKTAPSREGADVANPF